MLRRQETRDDPDPDRDAVGDEDKIIIIGQRSATPPPSGHPRNVVPAIGTAAASAPPTEVEPPATVEHTLVRVQRAPPLPRHNEDDPKPALIALRDNSLHSVHVSATSLLNVVDYASTIASEDAAARVLAQLDHMGVVSLSHLEKYAAEPKARWPEGTLRLFHQLTDNSVLLHLMKIRVHHEIQTIRLESERESRAVVAKFEPIAKLG